MRTLHTPASTHGRVLVEDAADALSSRGLLVLFHGYGQSADDMLDEARQIPGAGAWTLVSVQGLHRFYTRDHARVVANWMTTQDRDLAIADNVAYVDRAIEDVTGPSLERAQSTADRIVFMGFSQGAAMAYRAALLGRHEPAGVVALGGDIPPELKAGHTPGRRPPHVLIGAGTEDSWYTSEKLADDEAFLRSRAADPEVVRYAGGHEWTEEFRVAAGRWLKRLEAKEPRQK